MDDLYFDGKMEQSEESTKNNNQNKSFITFAKLDKYFLIPLLYALFNFLSILFNSLILNTGIFKNSALFDSVFYELSFVLSGFFFFIPCFEINVNIQKINIQKVTTNEEISTLPINYLYSKSIFSKINNNKIIFLILLLGLM